MGHVTVCLDRCAVLTSVVLMVVVVLVVCAVLQTTHTERGVPAPYQVKEDKVLILEAVEDKVSILDHKVLVTVPVDPLEEELLIHVELAEVPVEHVEGRQAVQE